MDSNLVIIYPSHAKTIRILGSFRISPKLNGNPPSVGPSRKGNVHDEKVDRNAIAVASMGDPRLASTSSGTTARVVQGLERLGMDVRCLDLNTIPAAYKTIYFLLYETRRRGTLQLLRTGAKSDYHWSRAARRHCARDLQRSAARLGVKKVLHMFLPGIPLTGDRDGGIEHYLLTDTTLHSQFQSLAAETVRYPKRLVLDALQMEREMFSHVKHFFPLGEYQRQDLIEHYGIEPSRITVVGSGPGGVPPYFGPKNYSQEQILFSAKVRFEEKGGPLLIAAFKIARAARPSLELKIIGQEHYRELIGKVPGVSVYGHIPFPELETLFQRASLFAMPAIWEPWGLVYLEALATRTPILGLNRNAMPEFTGDGRFGFLVNEASPEAVAAKLLEAFEYPDRLRRMGQEGQAYAAERYSWDQAASRIAEVMA